MSGHAPTDPGTPGAPQAATQQPPHLVFNMPQGLQGAAQPQAHPPHPFYPMQQGPPAAAQAQGHPHQFGYPAQQGPQAAAQVVYPVQQGQGPFWPWAMTPHQGPILTNGAVPGYPARSSPYCHFSPGPATKRGPGRPLGSKNKRRTTEDDPPAASTRSRRSNANSTGFTPIEIPEVHDWDYEISTQESAACSKCALNKGMFLCLPCSHYGFCLECLQRHEQRCREEDTPVTCMGCKRNVTEFVKYFRATLHN